MIIIYSYRVVWKKETTLFNITLLVIIHLGAISDIFR